MEKCEVCEKISKFDGICFYDNFEIYLCRSHYLKWNKHHKPYREHHKGIKPCTKEWTKMCEEEEKLLIKWIEEQKK